MDTLPPAIDARASAWPDPLRAGPLSLLLDSGGVRYVTWNGREVIRRIYGAVRDHNWGTVPGVISALDVQDSGSGFHVRYVSTHRTDDIHFVWRADISGTEDGRIRFAFDGEAKSTFRRNRIGLCVLHPIRECAGTVCRARYADGSEREIRFPDTIAAEQPVRGLHDLAGLAHEVAPGIWAELEFKGDLFETEDQRNWIDASFKTYGTPLRLPFPVEIPADTRVRQEVRLRLTGAARNAPHAGRAVSAAGAGPAVTVRILPDIRPLPAIGLGMASHGHPLLADEAGRLRVLCPAHLRVDVRVWEAEWRRCLERATLEAGQLDARLEVALHLDVSPEDGLAAAAEALACRRDVLARVIVFHRHQKSTTPAALRAARSALTELLPGVPLAAGTDADLYQLNLQRPPAEADAIAWSMNPQVHASDDASIAEAPEAVAHQVASVRCYFPGKPRVVSPVTLRPRHNPTATGPEPAVPPDELPPQVDPRQASIFGAAWTLAMIKALAESGAGSVTFYETTGWRGVMDTAAGSPLPAKFASVPGGVFPLYHVLADVGDFAGGTVRCTESSDPRAIASLLLCSGHRRRVLVANLGSERRRVAFEGIAGLALTRCLDAASVRQAMVSPEQFRVASAGSPVAQLELGPWSVATLDIPVDSRPSRSRLS